MNKICTDINQSKKLIELGLDVNTADMLWTYDFTVNDINGLNVITDDFKPEEKDIPAWSLNALLDIIPNRYALDKVNNEYFITHTLGGKQERFDNPLDAAFEMVCLLKENNKI